METSVDRLEFNTIKCFGDCHFRMDKRNTNSEYLRSVLYIVLSIFIIFTSCSLSKNLATCNFGKICVHRGHFIRVLIILNIFNSCLFILIDYHESNGYNENKGYFLIITMVVCYILLIINFPLVLIFLTNASPKNLRTRNSSQDADTPYNDDNEKTQQFVEPPAKNKEIPVIINLQHDDTSDGTSC